MTKKIKIYSYILLLANIILLAHSFIPHRHHQPSFATSTVKQSLGEEVYNCKCQSCSTLIKILEDASTQNGEDCDGKCCNHGKGRCFISVGYFGHNHDDSNHNIVTYFIIPLTTIIHPINYSEEYSYEELIVSIPKNIFFDGQGMRAPPVLFS